MAGLIDADGGLDFGTGLAWLTSGIGQAGLVITTSTSGAALFLAEYGPYGMAMDFDDASIAIANSDGSLNYQSQGDFSSAGAPLGPLSKLTYTAPSVKLTERADGFLGFQAHNLYLNSAAPANQSVTTGMVTGATYAITLTGSVSITLSGAATGTITAGTTTFTAASGTLTCGSTSGSGTVHLRRTPSVDTYVATTGAQVYDLPYVYSSGVRTGIMVEPAATNICTRSSSLVSPWSLVSITPTANAVAGLSGAMNADEVTINAGSSTHYAQFNLTWTAAVHTTYAIVRYRNHPFVQITSWDGTTSRYCNFDISNGTIGSASGMTGAIISLGGSTYLVAATSTTNMAAAGGNVTLAAIPASTSSANATWTAAGTEKYDFLHFQIETGTVATSPIITYGAAVARAADVLPLPGASLPAHGGAVTLFIEYRPRGWKSTNFVLTLFTDSTNYIDFRRNSATTLAYEIYSGGALQATAGVVVTAGAPIKAALAAALNDSAMAVNGAATATDPSVAMPVGTPTGLHLNSSGANVLQGPIDIVRVGYFVGRKPNAAMEVMTA